jgi:hypothetical protein
MKLKTISELDSREAVHVGLDVAGLIPGIGELADLTNMLAYIKEAENADGEEKLEAYFYAALSALSMIPEVGDLIGKGIKYLGKGSSTVAKLTAKHGPKITKYWDETKKMLYKIKEVKPEHIEGMVKAVKWANSIRRDK